MEAHCRTAVQDCVGNPQAGDFRNSAASVVKHGEHDVVPMSAPGRNVWGVDDGLHLHSGEEAEERPVEAFHGNREDTLDDGQGLWFSERREV